MSADTPLTPVERTILHLEAQRWLQPGAKHEVFRAAHPDVSEPVYYATLVHLIDKPAAAAVDPVLVARLRRLRAMPRVRTAR